MKLVEKSVVASRFKLQTAAGLLIAIAVLYLGRERYDFGLASIWRE